MMLNKTLESTRKKIIMVINNRGHSQSALEHYVYSLKAHDKVWQ